MAVPIIFALIFGVCQAINISSQIWTNLQADSLNQFFGKLGQDIERLKERTGALEEAEERCEVENKKLLKLVSVLVNENKLLKENSDLVNKTLTGLLSEQHNLKENLSRLGNDNGTLHHNYEVTSSQSDIKQGFCAFYAKLAIENGRYNDRQTVIFDSLESNIGNCYNSQTGIFTAASNGLVFFSWTVHSDDQTLFMSELVKNGESIATSRVLIQGESSTVSSVVSVEVGAEVWVRSIGSGHVYGHKLSSLLGFTVK